MKKTLLSLICLTLASAGFAQRIALDGHAVKSPSGGVIKTPTDTIVGEGMTSFDLACLPSTGGGWVGGNNGYGDLAKAQQFLLDSWTSTIVEEALFWFCAKGADSGDPASHITARVYGLDNTGTASFGDISCPGSTLAEVDIPFANVDSGSTLIFTIGQFPSPTYVGEQFAVGFSMEGLTAGDTLGLVSSDGGSGISDFAWEQFSDGTWFTTLSGSSWQLDLDWGIFAVLDNSSVGIDDVATFNGMRLSILSGNPTAADQVMLGYTVNHSAHMEVVVHNVKGEAVHTADIGPQAAGEYQHAFDVSDWSDGNYYVTVKANGETITKKLILRR